MDCSKYDVQKPGKKMKELYSGKSGKLNITISALEESNPNTEMDFLRALVSGLAESFVKAKEAENAQKKTNQKGETTNN